MNYSLVLSFIAIVFSPIYMAASLKTSDNKIFTINVKCNNQKECAYNNHAEIPVVVELSNISANGFYIPWEYIKKTGPSVELVDPYSRKSIILKQNLVSWDLKNQLLFILDFAGCSSGYRRYFAPLP